MPSILKNSGGGVGGSALSVEDISTVGLFDNQVAAVFDGYEFKVNSVLQEFQMRVTAGTKTISYFTSYDTGAAQDTGTHSVTLDQTWVPVWIDNTLSLGVQGNFQRLFWNDGTNSYKFRGIIGAGYNNNFIEIKRLNQKTVISTVDLPVSQDVGAGWEIRGDILECWNQTPSIQDTPQTITFPVAFQSPPVVTATMDQGTATDTGRYSILNVTTTGFDFNRADTDWNNTDNPVIHWRAIGLKV